MARASLVVPWKGALLPTFLQSRAFCFAVPFHSIFHSWSTSSVMAPAPSLPRSRPPLRETSPQLAERTAAPHLQRSLCTSIRPSRAELPLLFLLFRTSQAKRHGAPRGRGAPLGDNVRSVSAAAGMPPPPLGTSFPQLSVGFSVSAHSARALHPHTSSGPRGTTRKPASAFPLTSGRPPHAPRSAAGTSPVSRWDGRPRRGSARSAALSPAPPCGAAPAWGAGRDGSGAGRPRGSGPSPGGGGGPLGARAQAAVARCSQQVAPFPLA